MSEPNEAQKAAMIKFCLGNAGEIKYVPHFNEGGMCTVQVVIRERAERYMREGAAKKERGELSEL